MLDFSLYRYHVYGYLTQNNLNIDRLTYTDPVRYDNVSRYSTTLCILDELSGQYHETYESYVIPKSESDYYYKVEKKNENRLDIISSVVYNTPRFWWVIAMANGIVDPFKVPADTILRIPPIASIYQDGSVLS